MHEKSDAELLHDYAEHGQEAAFRELVARYTDLVYSAALRQAESSDLAADIAQNVFVDLARKARPISERLADHKSLAGWLHRSTRFLALNHLRDTHRRVTNERQAMEQLLADSESSVDWELIRPALDEALDSLADEDREALLLRYFKNHDFRAVGLALGTSDDAAQKRVRRAVERLREFFAKRGVTVGTSGLAVVITANAVQAAPVGLALTISTAAALTGTTLTTTAAITATKAIAMTTLQKTIVTITIAVLAGAGFYEARQASQLRNQVQTLQEQQTPLVEQIQKLQNDFEDATNRLAGLMTENSRLQQSAERIELLKLRGEVNRLRPLQEDVVTLQQMVKQSTKGATEWQPKDLLNAGRMTPQDALQTLFWSSMTTNVVEMRNSFVIDEANPPAESAIQDYFRSAPDQLALSGIAKIRILSQSMSSTGEASLEVQLQFNESSGQINAGTGVSSMMTMRKTDGEWKIVLANLRDKDGKSIGVDIKPRSGN